MKAEVCAAVFGARHNDSGVFSSQRLLTTVQAVRVWRLLSTSEDYLRYNLLAWPVT